MVDDKTILLAALDEAQAAFVKVNPMPSLLGSSPDGEILGPLEMAIEQCAAYQSVAGQVLFCGGSGPVLHAGPLASLLFSKGAWPTDNKDGAVDWLLKLLRTREATVLVIHLITSEYAPLIRDHVLPAVAKSRGRPWMEQLSEYFLRKSTRHLEAVCALVTESFGEDGLIIGRTLLEHSLYLAWVAAAGSPALQDERAQHFLFDGDRQRFEKRRELGRLKDEGKCLAWVDPLLTAEIETPAMAKPASFTSLPSLKRMAEELGGEFECYFHFVYWSVSKLAHPSGMGSHSYYVDDDGSEAWRALAFAFPQHALMTANTLAMFNEDELRSAVEQLARRFIALDSSSEPGASERQA